MDWQARLAREPDWTPLGPFAVAPAGAQCRAQVMTVVRPRDSLDAGLEVRMRLTRRRKTNFPPALRALGLDVPAP